MGEGEREHATAINLILPMNSPIKLAIVNYHW